MVHTRRSQSCIQYIINLTPPMKQVEMNEYRSGAIKINNFHWFPCLQIKRSDKIAVLTCTNGQNPVEFGRLPSNRWHGRQLRLLLILLLKFTRKKINIKPAFGDMATQVIAVLIRRRFVAKDTSLNYLKIECVTQTWVQFPTQTTACLAAKLNFVDKIFQGQMKVKNLPLFNPKKCGYHQRREHGG